MVFLKRSVPRNPRKRPAAPSSDPHPSVAPLVRDRYRTPTVSASADATADGSNAKGEGVCEREGEEEDQEISAMFSILAEAGCTLRVYGDAPPSLPADLYKARRHLEIRLSSGSDPQILPRFISGFSSYIQNPQNLRRVLLPASYDGGGSYWCESLARVLLLVAPIQVQMLNLLLEKLPEHFNAEASNATSSLKDDVARLIVNQLRWLDFLVDSESFAKKLMDVLSISPAGLKKEIIGSLPEIIGDKSHITVVVALEKILLEDSELIVPVLDSFSNLNLDEQLQEQAVTIALSCIRTVDGENMPYLLKFLLLSTTSVNAGRIISQIRDQLKFVGVVDSYSVRSKKLKGKSLADSTEASILNALRSSLQFKNILCESILKELKSVDQPRYHKVIDVWFLMIIYNSRGPLQNDAKKMLKKKIIDGCFSISLFDQCIAGNQVLVKDYFSSFNSVCEYLMSCKETLAREFSILLYKLLFEEFRDTFSRQEVLGSLVTHIGSGITYEVSSALETLILLTSRYSEDLIPFSSHITGILDYLEGFQDDNLHKVYEVFSRLALSSRSSTSRYSIADEVLMIIRKQISNADIMYKRMGVIGTLKIVSTLGDVNSPSNFFSSQKSSSEEACELLKMSLDSCKSMPLSLILLYDELVVLLEHNVLNSAIIEWISKHVCEFEQIFLSDLEGAQLPLNVQSDGIEGDLWINLDGDVSPVFLKILPFLSSSMQQQSSSLGILSSHFLLLSVVERLTNQGSLGGIDALLGCPLQLPSPKYLSEIHWKKLDEKQKKIVCFSLYFAINWIRELLNAFSSQITDKVESVTPNTKDETVKKLLKRLRNLVLLESILDVLLKVCPLFLPEVRYLEKSGPTIFQGKSSERVLCEAIPPNKKLKHKINPSASGNSASNGKLRQPTIIDALKKSGARASQETLDECSPRHPSQEKTSQCADRHFVGHDKLEVVDLSAEHKTLGAQRSKFRPLNIDSLSLLSFSECRDSCCADPAAELPLHLYLLRDFRHKLDDFSPPNKQLPTACPVKASSGLCRITHNEFLCKIRPVIGSLKKHLDTAVSILRDGSEADHNHWESRSRSAGNPDLSNLFVSESSVASSVFKEVLYCYRRILCLDELYHQDNLQILRDMLEAFQTTEVPGNFFSGLQPLPTPGNIDYLYCGLYSFLECILEASFLSSFLLASEVVVTLQSLVNSKRVLMCKSQEVKGKNMYLECSQNVLHHLSSRLALSAHKLLLHDWSRKDNGTEWKSNGDALQKILQIYITNTETTFDLLNELACSILPQVPSCKNMNTQDATNGFPTLCPTVFVIWYRILHEENNNTLGKLVKEVKLKHGVSAQREVAEKILLKIQQSVNVVVSLVNLSKVHDKVAVHAMAVKYGGKFIDLFLKAFDFLQAQFQLHYDLILQMLKELQKATRIMQALCSEAKGSKRTMVTNKVPATKRSMERFLFHVKALLQKPCSGHTFWMGSLKHKDLYGQMLSSQVYSKGDDNADQAEYHPRDELGDSVGDCDQQDVEN